MRKVVANKLRKSSVEVTGNSAVLKMRSNDFIFSQATIVSSVLLENKSNRLDPLTHKFVNSNGDCWSNPTLKANYKSFIGAYNYVNHVQIPSKSVGFIADATLRRINLDKKSGKFNYYTDLLIATHRDHSELCKNILSKDVEFLSMGCVAKTSTCSKCGKTYTSDEDLLCSCLEYSKGKTYVDGSGKRRIITEILGTEEPGSVDFIEASWLTEVPAFHGACQRNVIPIPKDKFVQVEMGAGFARKAAVSMYLG